MPFSQRNGLKIYYEVAGEGPPMVLVHANPFDHRLWMYQAARYSAFYKTVAVDLRGYGRSDKPETPFTLQDMADDVIGVCSDLGITRAPFFGVSVGSGISLSIALDCPDLVSALVLVGGASRGAPSMLRRIEGFLSGDFAAYQMQHLRDCVASGFPDTPRGRWLLRMFNEQNQNLSGACIANIFRARLACDLTSRLPDIKAPTLVVNGEHDTSLAAGRLTAQHIPGARHEVIVGAGHACNIEEPEQFDAFATAFLTDNRLWPDAR